VVDEGLNPAASSLHLDGQELVFASDPVPTRSDDGLQLGASQLASAVFDDGGST